MNEQTLPRRTAVDAPRPAWRPAPAIVASLAWHVALGAAALLYPAGWPWALGGIAANHALLTAAGLWPRSRLLGPNLTRLPAAAAARGWIALTFDDGPDPEVTPRVLDLLDAHGARASFFCIGYRARQHPALVREIVARGHRVENHGDAHAKLFATYGYRRMRADIETAQHTLADITGQPPCFFRPTAGLRNPLLEPVLQRLNLRLATWTRRGFDAVSSDPQRVLQRLRRRLAAGDILLLHDGSPARTQDGTPVSLTVLPPLLTALRQAGLQSVSLAEALREATVAQPAAAARNLQTTPQQTERAQFH
ncbi:MAG: polysaccharide deacetylase family protein [Sutterellaceae bacterium]|nr:polysaccharide deacetylase family protein [Burkholderiaceae bacterium]MDW8430384.1 polysaccharide deacetylase family protein [Sutterellaceae bacterium]